MTDLGPKYNNFCIEMNDCAECQGCCDEGDKFNQIMVSYAFLDATLKNKIPENALQQMLIFRIPAQIIDDAAKYLRMYPIDNLLKHMTILSSDGYYEYLSLPDGKCIFLSPRGCLIPEYKPYICAMFPFYVYKLQTHFNYACPASDKIENDLPVRECIGQLIVNYILYAEAHKEQYSIALEKIKQKYKLKVVEVLSYYPELVCK